MTAPNGARPGCFADPLQLQLAARIVRASLARQGLTLADLVPANAEPELAPAAQSRTAPDRRAAA